MWWFTILYILIGTLIGTICYVFWCEGKYCPSLYEDDCIGIGLLWPIAIIFGGVYFIMKFWFILLYTLIKKLKNKLDQWKLIS